MSKLPSFTELAQDAEPRLDVVALALAAEFREVDSLTALATLDGLGAELARGAEATSGTPEAVTDLCGRMLGAVHGFAGDAERYDHPDNSMLDLVLTRRRGLPIVLSVVYVEVARRAGIELAAIGLPGHFVVGQVGEDPPLLLDPFGGGGRLRTEVPRELLRPWRAHEIAMRMLNNLVLAYQRRGDLGAAIRAATMRTVLPAQASARDALRAELRAMQAQLN